MSFLSVVIGVRSLVRVLGSMADEVGKRGDQSEEDEPCGHGQALSERVCGLVWVRGEVGVEDRADQGDAEGGAEALAGLEYACGASGASGRDVGEGECFVGGDDQAAAESGQQQRCERDPAERAGLDVVDREQNAAESDGGHEQSGGDHRVPVAGGEASADAGGEGRSGGERGDGRSGEQGAVAESVLQVDGEDEEDRSSKWLAFDYPLTPDQLTHLRGGTSTPIPDQPGGILRDSDAPLLTELARDGRASIAELARATNWPETRVSTRLDDLLSSGALHVAVDLAYPRFGFDAAAYLWLTVTPGHLTAIGDALAQHPETTFAAAITGSANLLVTVTCRTLEDLYHYVTTKIGALDAVRQADVVPVLHRLKQAGTRLNNGRLLPT